MKHATISVIGPIGSFSIDGVQYNGIQLVDVVSQISKLGADLKDLTVLVSSDGGSTTVAKDIRNYLKQLTRINVTTKQVGDIASAGTIIWGSGKQRLAAKGINPATGQPFRFMVHMPWVTHTSGNADELTKDAADLRASEEELIAIYSEDIGIDPKTIAPLMKAESWFNADQAVNLGFATGTYTALQQAAYSKAPMNTNKNTKKGKTLLEKLAALLGEDVATDPPAELMGKTVLIDGQAPVDGVYTVVGGVITALAAVAEPGAAPASSAAPAATAKPAAAAKVSEDKIDKLIALIEKGEASKTDGGKTGKNADDDGDDAQDDGQDINALVQKEVAKALAPFKKGTKQTHVPVGYKPEDKTDLAKEWDRAHRANEIGALKRENRARYEQLFYAKYGKMPN